MVMGKISFGSVFPPHEKGPRYTMKVHKWLAGVSTRPSTMALLLDQPVEAYASQRVLMVPTIGGPCWSIV